MIKCPDEYTPLTDKDFFFLVDRYNDYLEVPPHRHDVFVLNCVTGCNGGLRQVGDSVEELGDYDLVLMAPGYEHAYAQGACTGRMVHQITVHFSRDMMSDSMLGKTQMAPIRTMLDSCRSALVFSPVSVMRVYGLLDGIADCNDDFKRVMMFMMVLHLLSSDPAGYRRVEATSADVPELKRTYDRRIDTVVDYVKEHFREEMRLGTLAALVDMTPTAFSRFFKSHTGKSISDFISDERISDASRLLTETRLSVAEVCFSSGFNNVSHFNRIFRRKKDCSPKEFREQYRRRSMMV